MRETIILSNNATKFAAAILALAATFGTVETVHARSGTEFQQTVENGIDRELDHSAAIRKGYKGVATVAVVVDGQGAVRSTNMVQSSGRSSIDREALQIAHRVRYPASGKERTVAMVLGFNRTIDKQAQARGAQLVQAWADDQRVMLANETTAQKPES